MAGRTIVVLQVHITYLVVSEMLPAYYILQYTRSIEYISYVEY